MIVAHLAGFTSTHGHRHSRGAAGLPPRRKRRSHLLSPALFRRAIPLVGAMRARGLPQLRKKPLEPTPSGGVTMKLHKTIESGTMPIVAKL